MTRRALVLVVLWVAGLAAACRGDAGGVDAAMPMAPPVEAPVPSPSPSMSVSPSPTVIPTRRRTVASPRAFTVCQAEEPNTLFIYGRPSRAARNVLEAIYDGPIDTLTYRSYPVILRKLPSLDDGDAILRAVEAAEGDLVVDTSGQTVILRPDTVVVDSQGQETAFSGGVVSMTQMVVSFTLRSDVTWADGEPVTADDSRFSYELARRLDDTPLRVRLLVDQTHSYNAVDEHTAVWTSIPGYRDSFSFQGFHLQNFYYRNFYQPLPRHVWGSASADQLAKAEVAHRYPLGWGPFVVQEWVDGDHITLVRNPHYFRAAEGLPYLDQVDIRFVSDLAEALSLLDEGECDLIAQDVIEREVANSGTVVPLLEAAELGIVRLEEAATTEWEHLDFSVQRSERVDEPAFFANRRTRQAVAMCVHRERIVGEAVSSGTAVEADSYVAADHPLYAGRGPYVYDPSTAMRLLDEIGWRDEDGDGVREAQGVTGIESGTPLSLTLLTNSDHLAHERVARILVENLAACGIRLDVRYLPADELFADGPDGPVFGRAFDLALFSWLNDLDAPCWLYLTSEIPQAENWWATSNNPGYSSSRYDAACTSALASFPGTEPYAHYHQRAQRILVRDLPVLPLYFVPKLIAVRPEVTGVVLDPTEELELWTIETFDVARESGP